MDVPITKPSMVSYADELDFNDLRVDLAKEKKNGFIRVTSGSREGCIFYQNGKEVAASCDNLSNIEAHTEILKDIKEPNTLIEVFNVSESQVKYLTDLNKVHLLDKEIDPVEELKVVEKAQTPVKPEKKPTVQSKVETKPVAELQKKTEPQVKSQAEVESKVKPQPEVETEVKPQAKVEDEVKPATESVSPTEAETTITAESKVETKPEPQPQAKPTPVEEPKTKPQEEPKPTEEPKIETKPEVEPKVELIDARPIEKIKLEEETLANSAAETKVEYVSVFKPSTQEKPTPKPQNEVKEEESPPTEKPQSEVAPPTVEPQSEVTPATKEPEPEVTPSTESESKVSLPTGESELSSQTEGESMVEGDEESPATLEPISEIATVEETETEPESEPASRVELMSKFGIKEPEEADVENFIESYSGGIISDEDLPNIEFTLTNKIRKSILGIPKITAAQVNLILDNSKGLEGIISIVAEYEAKGFLSGLRTASKEETFTEQITYATVIEIRKIFRQYP